MLISADERRVTLSDGESDFLMRGCGGAPLPVEEPPVQGPAARTGGRDVRPMTSFELYPSVRFMPMAVVAFVGNLINICLRVGHGRWDRAVHVHLSPARGGALALEVRVVEEQLCLYGHVQGLNAVLEQLGATRLKDTVPCPACGKNMLPPRALEPGNVGVCFGCMKPFRVTHAGLVTVRDAEIQSTPGLRSEIDKVVSVAKRD